MKKIFFITFVSLFFLNNSFGAEKHIVEAKIKNLNDKEIMVSVYDISGRELLLDTILNCTNGEFSFDKQFPEAVYVTFIPKSGFFDTKKIRGVVKRRTMTIHLYMVQGESYVIDGNFAENQLLYDISGSEINSVSSKLRSKYIDAMKYYDMESEYFSAGRSKKDRDSVYYIGEKINAEMLKEKMGFLQNNLNSQLSGLYLSELRISDFDKYYLLISENVKSGLFKNQINLTKKLSDLSQNNNKMNVGADIIDFTLTGLDGNSVTLSSLKGKYVLLYFWGSWCHWCIKGAPDLNKFYLKNQDKVEIIGIACNDKELDLKKAIQKNDIKWNNFLEINSLSFQYGITGFPTKILIDKDGKVVYRCEGESSDYYKSMEEYIK